MAHAGVGSFKKKPTEIAQSVAAPECQRSGGLGRIFEKMIPVQGIFLSLLRLNFEWRVKYTSDVLAGVEEAVLQRPFDWAVWQE
jgi:hypothetical protein